MYALNIDNETGRILSVTYEEFKSDDMIIVETLPEGDVSEYLYVNNEYVYEPLPLEEIDEPYQPSAQDDVDAMLIDHEYRLTLLELGVI